MDRSFENKAALRKDCKSVRAAIRGEERAEAEEKILSDLSSLAGFCGARLLLFYMPISSEVNVAPLFLSALNAGRKVALPRCEQEPGEMTFRLVRTREELSLGAYGVPEPPEDAPAAVKKADSRLTAPAAPSGSGLAYQYARRDGRCPRRKKSDPGQFHRIRLVSLVHPAS